jgi:hypothetical protein
MADETQGTSETPVKTEETQAPERRVATEKADPLSPLQKPMRLLDRDTLGRLGIPLGVSGRPLPVVDLANMEIDRDEGWKFKFNIDVLADDANPVMLYSELPYREAVGRLYRDLPVPSMLPIMMDGLQLRSPNSSTRAQNIEGMPGFGKSHFAKCLARMRSRKGVLESQVGGRNADELLFETTLDLEGNADFYAELNQRLAKGTAKDETVATLREALGESFIEGGKDAPVRFRIDFKKAIAPKDDKDGRDSAQRSQAVLDILTRVSALEGLAGKGGNSLGLRSQHGPIIRAWIEGRELLLDEYNKRRMGTGDTLQAFWQFMSGEIDEVTVDNPLKETKGGVGPNFTFRRSDMPVGFFVTLTGNAITDSETTHSGSRSFNSRIPGYMLNRPSPMDWQHRICQVWTGVPVSTLYLASEKQWREKPEEYFASFLWEIRTLGLSPEQIKAIPKREKAMIENWKSVLEASQRLANALSTMSDALDPESPIYQDMKNNEIQELTEEVTSDFHKRKGVDFRFIIQMHKKALTQSVSPLNAQAAGGFDVTGWNDKPEKIDAPAAPAETQAGEYGSRFTKALLRELRQRCLLEGKIKTYNYLEAVFARCEVMRGAGNKEIPSGKKVPFETLLNVQEKGGAGYNEVRDIQTLLADYLRARFPTQKFPSDDTQVVTTAEVQSGLALMEALAAGGENLQNRNFVTLADDEWDNGPFRVVSTAEMRNDPAKTNQPPVPNGDLLDINDFLTPLALTGMSQRNMKALWTEVFSKLHKMPEASDECKTSIEIAEGRSATGFGVTTLVVAREGKPSTLHVVRDMHSGDTVLLGFGAVRGPLEKALRRQNIRYIDGTEKSADAKLRQALNDSFNGRVSGEMEWELVLAYTMRNQFSSDVEKRIFDPKGTGVSLPEVLLDKDQGVCLAHYITNRTIDDAALKDAQQKIKAGQKRGLGM